ncbi:hypothetical protein GCM10027195_13080 [Comamonas sediminis]
MDWVAEVAEVGAVEVVVVVGAAEGAHCQTARPSLASLELRSWIHLRE